VAKIVTQKVSFKGVSPDQLYRIYMDAKKHGSFIGSKVTINKKVGAKFSAFNGMVYGKNLCLVPNKMIVQTWRGKDWVKFNLDSILMLTFHRVKGGAEIKLVHTNVPEKHYKGIVYGWQNYYWKKWLKK